MKDEVNIFEFTYMLVSARQLSAADIRRALARTFGKTDVWPNEEGTVEIRV